MSYRSTLSNRPTSPADTAAAAAAAVLGEHSVQHWRRASVDRCTHHRRTSPVDGSTHSAARSRLSIDSVRLDVRPECVANESACLPYKSPVSRPCCWPVYRRSVSRHAGRLVRDNAPSVGRTAPPGVAPASAWLGIATQRLASRLHPAQTETLEQQRHRQRTCR